MKSFKDHLDKLVDTYNENNVIPESSSSSLQLPRRFLHIFTGLSLAVAYLLVFQYQQIVSFFGTVALLVYIFDHIRVSYPDFAAKFNIINKYFFRKDEILKLSSAIPYSIAILFVIISSPKSIAIISIMTFALADPLAAIVGIKLGRHKIAPHKSLEGSITFFIISFFVHLLIFNLLHIEGQSIWFVSFFNSLIVTLIEAIPSKLDDNIIIPLSISLSLRLLLFIFSTNDLFALL